MGYIPDMTRPVLADAFGHHCWATIRLLEACEPLTEDQLATVVDGTFGSMILTLRHVVAGDRGYLTLLSDALPDVDEESLDIAAMKNVMTENAPVWQDVVAAPDVERDVIRHRPDGSKSHAPLGIRLAQVIHHGTDHRSQVCTGLTNLGIVPPDLDVFDYGRLDGRVYLTDEPAPEA
jgi:uncharacterized damage-inducible protein DinB